MNIERILEGTCYQVFRGHQAFGYYDGCLYENLDKYITEDAMCSTRTLGGNQGSSP